MRALAPSHRWPPSKRNVPPFQGGTWEHSRRKAVGVNAASQRFLHRCLARTIPVAWKNNCNADVTEHVDCEGGLLRGSHAIL